MTSGGNVQPGILMAKLNLSLAVGPYDRTRALIDGSVQIDGVSVAGMTLSPEEIFFRAFRQAEFDICELSLSSFTLKTAQGNCPYVGVPAFVSRAFRHTAIYVRTDRIKKPADLKGKRVGVPEYQQTAALWIRGALENEFGVSPRDVTHFMERPPSRSHAGAVGFKAPPGVTINQIPPEKSIGSMMVSGELDACMFYIRNQNLVDRST